MSTSLDRVDGQLLASDSAMSTPGTTRRRRGAAKSVFFTEFKYPRGVTSSEWALDRNRIDSCWHVIKMTTVLPSPFTRLPSLTSID